jgi:hypothetical protein
MPLPVLGWIEIRGEDPIPAFEPGMRGAMTHFSKYPDGHIASYTDELQTLSKSPGFVFVETE